MQPDHEVLGSTRNSHPRRRSFLVAVAATAAVLAGCASQFHVTKEVTGGDPAGPFTVHISCTSFVPDGEPTPPSFEDDITLDAPFPANGDSAVFEYFAFGDCTITEPDAGGATSVTISCVDPIPAATCGPPGPSLSVGVGPNSGPQTVNIRVVNDFGPTTTTLPPDPSTSIGAAAVDADPNFTG